MNEPVWVLDSVVSSIHQILLAEHGGSPGVRDEALLSSALMRPKQRFAYEPESSIFELAGSYGFGLARDHPFIDGNKRTAFTVSTVFLELNGASFDAPEPEVVLFFESLAAGSISEHELADWFKASSG
ncbi:MAG: type II toxin-antitoxin system death-on-curing family toxin [Gammaproteobacteria bacterium]|nr:MAG: type II toxin-antitoxin system death-on-curing family toxin [Gammaproteobacteria bacterium]